METGEKSRAQQEKPQKINCSPPTILFIAHRKLAVLLAQILFRDLTRFHVQLPPMQATADFVGKFFLCSARAQVFQLKVDGRTRKQSLNRARNEQSNVGCLFVCLFVSACVLLTTTSPSCHELAM